MDEKLEQTIEDIYNRASFAIAEGSEMPTIAFIIVEGQAMPGIGIDFATFMDQDSIERTKKILNEISAEGLIMLAIVHRKEFKESESEEVIRKAKEEGLKSLKDAVECLTLFYMNAAGNENVIMTGEVKTSANGVRYIESVERVDSEESIFPPWDGEGMGGITPVGPIGQA